MEQTVPLSTPLLTDSRINMREEEGKQNAQNFSSQRSDLECSATCELVNAPEGSAELAEREQVRRKLLLAMVLCFVFMLVEVAGGILANSLAIMTDAAHLLSDVAGFAISLFALWMAGWEATPKHTFGYHRMEILGALVSMQFIWMITGILVYEAIVRMITQDHKVDGRLMFITAAFGVAVNILMTTLLGHTHAHGPGGHDHDHGHGHDHGHSHGSSHDKPHGSLRQTKTKEPSDAVHSHDHSQNGQPDPEAGQESFRAQVSSGPQSVRGLSLRPLNPNPKAGTYGYEHKHASSIKRLGPLDGYRSLDGDSHEHTEQHAHGAHPHRGHEGRPSPRLERFHSPSHSQCGSPRKLLPDLSDPSSHGHSHDLLPKGPTKAENINLRGAYLHVLGDLIQSVGVMIGGALIWWRPEWKIVDLLCTLLFSMLVLFTTLRMLRDVMEVLMESTPREINAAELEEGIRKLPGVVDVHELHIWAITKGKVVLACHVRTSATEDTDQVLYSVLDFCENTYGISHATVQVERDGSEP